MIAGGDILRAVGDRDDLADVEFEHLIELMPSEVYELASEFLLSSMEAIVDRRVAMRHTFGLDDRQIGIESIADCAAFVLNTLHEHARMRTARTTLMVFAALIVAGNALDDEESDVDYDELLDAAADEAVSVVMANPNGPSEGDIVETIALMGQLLAESRDTDTWDAIMESLEMTITLNTVEG